MYKVQQCLEHGCGFEIKCALIMGGVKGTLKRSTIPPK